MPDNINFENFQKIISVEKQIYFRALMCKREKEWAVHCLRAGNLPFVTTLPAPFVQYKDVVFVSGQVTGNKISEWLLKGKIFFENREYSIPKLQNNLYVRKFPSLSNVFWLKLAFPFTTYQTSHNDLELPANQEPLIAENAPSFQSLLAAVQFYFYGEEYKVEHKIPQSFDFFIAHQKCWFQKVYLRSSSIQIEVNGSNVKNVRLEVRAGLLHFEKKLKKAGKVNFPFPDGLPENLWIILSYENEWLDYRLLNLNPNYQTERKDVINETIDKPTEIEGMIARGEGETTEFKSKVPIEKESIKKLIKTVAAFANGSGGIIITGVEDRTGKIVGIHGDIDKEYDRLSQIIRNNITPQPDLSFEKHSINGFCLFAVTVKTGSLPPYGIEPDNPRYFVRRGATTFPASQDEVRSLAQKGMVFKTDNFFS